MFVETIIYDAVHADDARAPASAIAGRWRNRLGSVMELNVDDGHHIHGTFHSEVGVPHPLTFGVTGFAEGDALTFCVDFGKRGSVAAWAGHHITDGKGERLVTLWHLVQPVRNPHAESDVWRATMAGSDEFTRDGS